MKRLNAFQKTAIATLIATILLIFVGGIVRATGSGLGCPDWPKCWGKWWPPATAEQIPAETDEDGRRFYAGHHDKKHFVSEFNAVKMWTEYINRLIGVVIGLFVFATFVLSFRYRKSKPPIFWGSLAAFLLVAFQGWLGGVVVRSELKPGMITLHLVAAIVLMALLLWIAFRAVDEYFDSRLDEETRTLFRRLAVLLFALTVVQVVLGSQVREALHAFEHAEAKGETASAPRSEWIASVGFVDHVHRSFSWLVLICAGFLFWKSLRVALPQAVNRTTRIIFVLVVLQIVYGIALAYFGLPRVFQVLHLGFASVLICVQFLLVLVVGRSPTESLP